MWPFDVWFKKKSWRSSGMTEEQFQEYARANEARKKEQQIHPPKPQWSLTIVMKEAKQNWSTPEEHAFRPFVRWWEEEREDYFMLRDSTGMSMIRRDQILYFRIEKKTVQPPVPEGPPNLPA